MSCTYHRTGAHFESQTIWECEDCNLRDGEAFCAGCRQSCHAQCKRTRQIETARAYCDCGARGVDKCAGMRRAIDDAAAAATAAAASAASVVAASSSPASPVAASTAAVAAQSDAASAASAAAAAAAAAAALKAASAGRPKSTQLQASAHQRHHSAAAATTRRVRAAGTAPPPTAAAAPASPHAAAAAALLRGSLYSLSTGGFGSHAPSPPPFTSAPPSECTFLRTGTRFTAQPLYACYTCGMSDDLAVCYYCVLRCHTHHEVAFVSESARAYCDCGSRCAPKSSTPTAAQSRGMGLGSLFGSIAAPASPPSATSGTAASAASSASSAAAAAAPRVIPPCQALTPLPYAEAQALAFLCTLVQTGKRFHRQKLFHCRDCNIAGDEVCCQPCAELCHRGHSIEEREAARAYCDCSANGLCQTLDIASVVRARSAYSSNAHTPFSHLSRRSSLTADGGIKTPQLELTILSQSTPGSKMTSAANSRRSSLGAQTRQSLLAALEPPPPEDKAPVPPPMPRAQSAHTLTLPKLPVPEPTSPASAPPAVSAPVAPAPPAES